jgi:cell division protein FtsI (penicillin-binding protein 3)
MLVPTRMGRGRRPRTRRRGRRRLRADRTTRRALALLLGYLLVFGALGHRLVVVQIVQADEYAALGAQQRSRTIDLPATRGRIYDRNGDVLATSVDAATIYADPRAFRPQPREDGLVAPPAADADEVAAALAPLLDRPAEALAERLRRDAHFVYLARQIPYRTGEEIMEMRLAGIGMLAEPARIYPSGPLAGQVLGFVGVDGEGLAGLEVQYEAVLRGDAGFVALERAPGDLTITPGRRHVVAPVDGTDLVLTLDREIQHVAERAAARAMEEHGARAAGVVVADVRTGEVLALASLPGYDPNAYASADASAKRSRPVTDHLEPGSIQKVVTVAAALEEGVATPDSTFDVGKTLTVGGKTFTDVAEREPGPMTVREIVAESSNIGTILLAQELGEERLARYLTSFGYGQPLGIGYPGEGTGSVLPPSEWSRTSLPTIAIGHGVSMTLLQAANVYAAIANDGVAAQPRLVRGTVGDDGRLSPSPPPATRRVVSEATAIQLRAMLIEAVDGERATGRRARVPGYSVAGKTGTAKKPLEGERGYSEEYIASFVGFAPVDDPRIVVAVMVDGPSPVIFGGAVAAPVFSEVMEFALGRRRVPPDAAGP